jgi:hypothetical protein
MAGSLVDAAVISVISIAPIMDYVIIFKSTFFEKSDEIYGYIMIYPCHVKLKKILSMLEEKVKVNE